MPHFFQRRDIFGNSPAVWILAAILFAIPFGSWSLSQLDRRDDAGMWLAPSDAARQADEWASETFPLQQDLLVTWNGSSLNDPRIAEFRHRLEPTRDEHGVLRGGQPHIARISDPREAFQRMLAEEVSPAEAVQRLTGSGLGRGPLRVRLTDEGRKRLRRIQAELPDIAKKRWGTELRITASQPAPQFGSEADDSTTAAKPIVLSTDGVLQDNGDAAHDLCIIAVGLPDSILIDWLKNYQFEGLVHTAPVVADLFYLPGSPLAVGITFSDAGRADRAEALQRVESAAAELGIAKADLHIIGPAVLERDLESVTRAALWNPTARWQQVPRRSALLTSFAAGVLLTVLLLRDARLVILCVLTTAGAVFATLALMPVAGTSLTAWQFTTPVWMGAFTLAGTIHVARQWQRRAIDRPEAAVSLASRQTMVAGLTATGMVFLAVIAWAPTPLAPIRDWAEAASVALLATIVLIHLGMPSLLLLWNGKTTAHPHDPAVWQTLGGWWTRHPVWQSLGTLAVVVAAAAGLRQAHLQVDGLRGLPATAAARQSVAEIESQLAGTMVSEAIVRFDERAQEEHDALERLEMIREVENRLRLHPSVSGCVSWAGFFPVTEPLAENASRLDVNRRAKRAQAQLDDWRENDSRTLISAYYSVAASDRDAELDGDRGYCRRGDELWRITTQVRWNGTADLAQTQRELDDVIRGVLKAAPGTRHHLLGSLALQVRTERLALRSFLMATGIAAGLMVLIAMVTLRHFGAGLLVLLPSAAPIAAVLGGWSWLGHPIDLTALLSGSLALGLSAGQIIPMLMAFHRSRDAGQSRADAVMSMLGETGPQVCRSAWIVGLMLWPLSTSEAFVIGHLGQLVPLMIAAGTASQMMWLPQLLAGPWGLIFAQGPTLERPSETSTDETIVVHRAA